LGYLLYSFKVAISISPSRPKVLERDPLFGAGVLRDKVIVTLTELAVDSVDFFAADGRASVGTFQEHHVLRRSLALQALERLN